MKRIERFLKRKQVKAVLGDDYVLNIIQTDRLLKILVDDRSVKRLEDWLPAMAYFVKLDLTNYVGRYRRLKKMAASPDLYNMVLRYGKKEGMKRYEDYVAKKTKHFLNIEKNLTDKGMSIVEARRKISDIQKTRANKAAQVLRGTSEYSVRSMTFWLSRGYTMNEAEEQVRRVQVKNGVEWLCSRGVADPIQLQSERNQKWLNNLNNKDDDEKKRIRLAKSHSIEGYMASGISEEQAIEKSLNYFSKRRNFSNISQICFDMVADRIGTCDLYYKTLNHEKQFCGKNVDFYDNISKTVIEFYGDYWHANPLKYSNTYKIYNKYACDVRLDDSRRLYKISLSPAVKNLYIVWESEYRENPTATVKLVIDTLFLHRNELNETI